MINEDIPKTLKELNVNGHHTDLGKKFNSREQFMGYVASELKTLNKTVTINTADIKILNDFKGRIYGGVGVLLVAIGLVTKLSGLW